MPRHKRHPEDHPNQSHPGQPHSGQLHPGQSHPGQPHPAAHGIPPPPGSPHALAARFHREHPVQHRPLPLTMHFDHPPHITHSHGGIPDEEHFVAPLVFPNPREVPRGQDPHIPLAPRYEANHVDSPYPQMNQPHHPLSQMNQPHHPLAARGPYNHPAQDPRRHRDDSPPIPSPHGYQYHPSNRPSGPMGHPNAPVASQFRGPIPPPPGIPQPPIPQPPNLAALRANYHPNGSRGHPAGPQGHPNGPHGNPNAVHTSIGPVMMPGPLSDPRRSQHPRPPGPRDQPMGFDAMHTMSPHHGGAFHPQDVHGPVQHPGNSSIAHPDHPANRNRFERGSPLRNGPTQGGPGGPHPHPADLARQNLRQPGNHKPYQY